MLLLSLIKQRSLRSYFFNATLTSLCANLCSVSTKTPSTQTAVETYAAQPSAGLSGCLFKPEGLTYHCSQTSVHSVYTQTHNLKLHTIGYSTRNDLIISSFLNDYIVFSFILGISNRLPGLPYTQRGPEFESHRNHISLMASPMWQSVSVAKTH